MGLLFLDDVEKQHDPVQTVAPKTGKSAPIGRWIIGCTRLLPCHRTGGSEVHVTSEPILSLFIPYLKPQCQFDRALTALFNGCQKPLGLFVLLAIQQATHCFLSLQPLKPLLIQQQLVIFWNNRQLDAHQYTITMTRFQRTSSVRWACDLHLADVLLKTGVWWRRLLPGQFGRQCPQHLYRFSTLQRPGLDWALQVVGKQQDMLFSLLLLPSILLVMTILNGALSVEHLSFAENGCVLENHSMEQAYRTIGL